MSLNPPVDIKPPLDRQTRTINLPLSATEWATLQAPFPISEDSWKLMEAVLKAMKPGLVAGPGNAAPKEQEGNE